MGFYENAMKKISLKISLKKPTREDKKHDAGRFQAYDRRVSCSKVRPRLSGQLGALQNESGLWNI